MASGGARRGKKTSAGLLTLFERWVALHNSPPEILYHYSTAQGMLSMLQSGHVWATESRYMNDSREFVHGSDLILSVIKRHHRKKATKTLQQLRTAVMEHVNEKRQNLRIFCVSFCADGDLLSQWRGYGDDGGGYALGFRPEFLYGRARVARPPVRVLRRVLYDPEEQERIVDAWIRAVHQREHVPQEFWRFFSEAIISFKDPAFAKEGEWRLIQFGRAWSDSNDMWLHPVQFRERRGQIIPFADLDLSQSIGESAGKLPIGAIVHGPTQDPERSGKALRLLMEARGYDEKQVIVRRSKIPFTG